MLYALGFPHSAFRLNSTARLKPAPTLARRPPKARYARGLARALPQLPSRAWPTRQQACGRGPLSPSCPRPSPATCTRRWSAPRSSPRAVRSCSTRSRARASARARLEVCWTTTLCRSGRRECRRRVRRGPPRRVPERQSASRAPWQPRRSPEDAPVPVRARADTWGHVEDRGKQAFVYSVP